MTRIPGLFLTLTAAPALAHSGPHLHPHGSDAWLVGVLVLFAAGVAAFLKARK